MAELPLTTAPTLYAAISFHYQEGSDNYPRFETVAAGLDNIEARLILLRRLVELPVGDQSKWDIGRRLLQIGGLVQKTVVQLNLPYATAYADQRARTETLPHAPATDEQSVSETPQPEA